MGATQPPILVNAELVTNQPPPPKTPENEVQSIPIPQICIVCRRHHGSVRGEVRCLAAEVLKLRTEGDRLREIILRFEPK
jgi:hypothetical protein